MKKTCLSVFVLIFALCLVFTAFACNKNKGNPDDIQLKEYTIPDDLGDYGLTIEWLAQNGSPTTFNPKKPVVILLEGAVSEGYKSGYSLDADIYSVEKALHTDSRDINHNLAFYWWNMGFNVGVFHYENYAIGSLNDIVKKIYNKKSVYYVNKDGVTVYPTDSQFNLTEVFVYLWLDLLKRTPIVDTDTPYSSQEIRFIGNSVGANLAISVADFLYTAYNKGLVPPYCVPNRISLINPYFSNENLNVKVDFRSDTLSSLLAYNKERIAELAREGVVFELVESDPEFYNSYATPYSGLVETEESAALGDSGDCALYKDILSNCASLTFNQTYDRFYTESYLALDRTALDWYLYSIRGSDYTVIDSPSYGGPDNSRPMADNYRIYTNYRLYAVAAWTPTPYLRAVRGVEYKMQTLSYNSDTNKYDIIEPYTMTKFRSEAFQCSNLDKSYVCGYVYLNKNKTKYLNWGADTRLADVEITITLENSNQTDKRTFVVRTQKDGFYSFVLERKYYQHNITVTVMPPSPFYTYSVDRQISESFYEKYTISTINKAEAYLDQTYMTVDDERVQIIFNNCGLILDR